MAIPEAVGALERDLRGIFGSRLQSLAIYGQRGSAHAAHDAHEMHGHGAHGHHAAPTRTLAVVESMTLDDLRAAARQVERWHDEGLATPLVVAAHEFERSLDAFPLEFGAILADHVVVSGENPFASLRVDPADVRRACEVQARSHLLHLRQGFLETRGRGDALAVLIVQSAAAFAGLISSIARLEGRDAGEPGAEGRHVERELTLAAGSVTEVTALVGVHEISSEEGERIFPRYLAAVQRLVAYVDGWSAR
jgi:hypothetical protein